MTRRRFGLVTFGLAMLLVAGCAWPMAGQGPDRRAWSRFETAITPENFKTLVPGWTGPGASSAFAGAEVVGNRDHVYVRPTNEVRALDPATGGEQWRGSYPGTSTPALRENVLTIETGRETCGVHAVDAATGSPLHHIDIDPIPLANATVTHSRTCTAGPSVFVDDGIVIVTWFATLSTQTSCSTGPGSWTTRVGISAFTPDLRKRWEYATDTSGCGYPIPDNVPSNTPKFGEVARSGKRVVVRIGAAVAAFRTSCALPCVPDWLTAVGPAQSGSVIALPGGSVATSGGALRVLDGASGAQRWSGAGGGLIAANDSFIFVASTTAQTLTAYPIVGCAAPTCVPAWTAAIGDFPVTRPSIIGNVVIFGTVNGAAGAFDARGCGGPTCYPIATPAGLDFTFGGPYSVIAGRLYAPKGVVKTFALPKA